MNIKTIYLSKFQDSITFNQKRTPEHNTLNKKITFKILKFKEVTFFQNILRKCNIFKNLIGKDTVLINYEVPSGNFKQRIDLLFLNSKGILIPCELKLNRKSYDIHGQLIRYFSDLHFQKLDKSWLIDKHNSYISKLKKNDPDTKIKKATISNAAITSEQMQFDDFIKKHKIKKIRISSTGIIINEEISDKVILAVQFLNKYHKFDIKLFQANIFVHKSWNKDIPNYPFKIFFKNII